MSIVKDLGSKHQNYSGGGGFFFKQRCLGTIINLPSQELLGDNNHLCSGILEKF